VVFEGREGEGEAGHRYATPPAKDVNPSWFGKSTSASPEERFAHLRMEIGGDGVNEPAVMVNGCDAGTFAIRWFTNRGIRRLGASEQAAGRSIRRR
jgi:hypothetical protein